MLRERSRCSHRAVVVMMVEVALAIAGLFDNGTVVSNTTIEQNGAHAPKVM